MTHGTTATDKISRFITVIDEIAFQANLLALNAAVEAARADGAPRHPEPAAVSSPPAEFGAEIGSSASLARLNHSLVDATGPADPGLLLSDVRAIVLATAAARPTSDQRATAGAPRHSASA